MKILNRYTGETIMECANLRHANLRSADLQGANLQGANLRNADLRNADLQGANLRNADLRHANLQGADLRSANLQGANLQGADLRNANLQGADLRNANLQGANLQGANLDFSCIPLHCGSTEAITDDRLMGQILFHLTRMNYSNCSGGVREAIDHIKNMAISDLFCEYRSDVEPIKEAPHAEMDIS